MFTANGNASATRQRVLSGRGLSHRRLDARQRAALAADVLAGSATIKLTARQLANLLSVSVPYIALAASLTPEKREAILKGLDPTSFTVLLNPPAVQLALPAPRTISDAEIADMIRTAGIDRTLAVAVTVEGGIAS